MTTITLEGVDWSCESPSEFRHDTTIVHFCRSEYTDRRWWAITDAHDYYDVDCAFPSRRDAMAYAVRFIIGQQRSAFDA